MNEEYRLNLYPFILRKITAFTEGFIDELDNDASFMYDEYPDKEYTLLMMDKLHKLLDTVFYPEDDELYSLMCSIADATFVNQIYLKRAQKD